MIIILLILLIVLWLLGYIHINASIPNAILFSINGHPITLWNLLTFLVLAALIGVLPNPFRAIAAVFLVLWILSLLGILFFAGLSSILILAIILGLVVYLIAV